MRFHSTTLKDAMLIEIEPRGDSRGFFARTMCIDEMGSAGLETVYVQQNLSVSARQGTLRGMHYQVQPFAEVKLVRCVRGSVCDVIVDVRAESPTYLQHEAFELSEENRRQLYVPRGFAHGFITLTDDVEMTYMVSARHSAPSERGLRYDDPRLGIEWPVPITLVSDKDKNWPLIDERPLPLF